jgi:hypothetical protein
VLTWRSLMRSLTLRSISGGSGGHVCDDRFQSALNTWLGGLLETARYAHTGR